MASFRGVEQAEITRSLNDFFDYLQGKNIGPLTTAAIAAWRAPGGMMDQVAAAPDAAGIESALRKGGDGQPQKGFVFWMDSYYSSLLPQIYSSLADAGQNAEGLKLYGLIAGVAAWGGFSMQGGRLSVMTSEDHEIHDYCENVLKCSGNDFFARFNGDAFRGPFEGFRMLYNYNPDGSRTDFNRAAQSLTDLAKAWGMADHVGYIDTRGAELVAIITPKLARTFAERAAADIADKTLLPVGLAGKQGFLAVKPPQP